MSGPKRRWRPDSPFSFEDYDWGSFNVDAIISKRVAEVLQAEMAKEGPYVVFTTDRKSRPLTIILGWPFGDTFYDIPLRDLFTDLIDEYRMGGNGPVKDDEGELAAQIAALRQLADDMEKLAGLAP